MQNGRLRGRVVALTGGGSGLGRAIVERFLEEGSAIAVLEISPERAASLENASPQGVAVVQGDATRLADNERLVARAVDEFGHLDCFIANAGVWDFGTTAQELPIDARFDEAFDQLFAVNVKAPLAGAKAAIDPLRHSRGSFVVTASGASFHPGGGGPIYTASKHAVIGLIRQLAYELAPEIRVNGVAPGGMLTELAPPPSLTKAVSTIADLPLEGLMSTLSPLQFLPQPRDYTDWYVALASATEALTMTGSVIECDVGESVRGRAFSEQVRQRTHDPRADRSE